MLGRRLVLEIRNVGPREVRVDRRDGAPQGRPQKELHLEGRDRFAFRLFMTFPFCLNKKLDISRSEWPESTVQREHRRLIVICKDGQISVCPGVGTSRDLLPQLPPLFTEVRTFPKENYTVVLPPFVVDAPGSSWG